MQEISGALTMLGNSKLDGGKKYSLIEIGDQILRDIEVSSGLDNFLQRGVGEEIAIWLDGREICAVRLQDGKAYILKPSPVGVILLLILGIAALPFFGIGLIFLWVAYRAMGIHRTVRKVRKILPNAIEV